MLKNYSTLNELIKRIEEISKRSRVIDVWFENKWICLQYVSNNGCGGVIKIKNLFNIK